MKKQPKYFPEVIERAVRMVSEASRESLSQWAAITSIAAKIGCTPKTICRWIRHQETHIGQRPNGFDMVGMHDVVLQAITLPWAGSTIGQSRVDRSPRASSRERTGLGHAGGGDQLAAEGIRQASLTAFQDASYLNTVKAPAASGAAVAGFIDGL